MKYLKTLIVGLMLTALSFGQSLTGVAPANSYKDWLHLSNSNTGVDATLRPIYDGIGNATALKISTLMAEVPIINATTSFQLNGVDINTSGTLSNVAYNNAWSEPQEGMIFDGTDDYVTINATTITKIGLSDFVLEFLIDGWGVNLGLFERRIDANNRINITYDGGIITFGIKYSGTSYGGNITLPSTPTDGDMHYLILSVDRDAATNGQVTAYLDGIASTPLTFTSDMSAIDIDLSIAVSNWMYNSFAGLYYTGNTFLFRWWNIALTQAEVTNLYNNGEPQKAKVPFKYRWGSQTAQTSGTLVIGKAYRINTFVSGDDFTNVGGTNVSGNEFVATGTTPTTWTNSSSLVRIGAVLDILGKNMGSFGVVDASSNLLNGSTSGSPQVLHKGDEVQYVDTKLAMTGATTLTDVVPKGYQIQSIYFKNTTANAVTGGIKIGSTSGGTEVVNGDAVGANAEGLFTLASDFFSSSADQTLYVDAVTAWNSASIDIIIKMKKVN